MADGVWPEVLIGDVRAVLRTLPDESVHCAITSPPYWGLRDYGVEGQIGLEPTPEAHIAVLLEVFRELWRVLRKDGTLWLNYGDCYACAPNGRKAMDIVNDDRTFRDKPFSTVRRGATSQLADRSVSDHQRRSPTPIGLKPKDLVGMPWRLAFALQADGWWIRSAITLCKNNPMPESVTDRPTQATEMLFLLTRSERYFYDSHAIREDAKYGYSPSPGAYDRLIGANQHRDNRKREGRIGGEAGAVIKGDGSTGRNRRNWWLLNSQPTPEAHFATFSEKLVEPCILAGTSEAGCCPECGAPWRRTVEKESRPGLMAKSDLKMNNPSVFARGGNQAVCQRVGTVEVQTTGWAPTCTHQHPQAALVPAVVLDPFAGSGTTLRVATRLGRRSIGIELSETYVRDILRKRTAQGGLGI